MRKQVIDIMEKTLSAYTYEHILRYFSDVKEKGLTEHGFPRLTVNIGVLIAHGRRRDLLPIFLEMMEFCCKTIPHVKAAIDFSVREIVCCILEMEKSGAVPMEYTERWRGYLAIIKPSECYSIIAKSLTDSVRNWALFTGVSEYFRFSAGIGGDMDFIELQIGQQLQWFDENGMYRDSTCYVNRQPIVYDLVPRALFVLLLSRGYRGIYYEQIDRILRKSALLTLDMQSPNGEVAFGGRSNQFLHNEMQLITIFEYEACRYMRENDPVLAARFKAAAARALAVTESWLDKYPIKHVKNRFPTERGYGCEEYAYFDKYMITVASFLYASSLVCDDTISFEPTEDRVPALFVTSHYFHKLFAKAGGYGLEFDFDGDTHYDASGLGRIHRAGAPSAICLSCPCPSAPDYTVDIEEPIAFSLCSAVRENGEWIFGANEGSTYEMLNSGVTKNTVTVKLGCRFENGMETLEEYEVGENGVTVTVTGDGEIGFLLPAFDFDGEKHTEISIHDHSVSVIYEGWICHYSTNANISYLNKLAANRNGHYRVLLASANNELTVKIEITKL